MLVTDDRWLADGDPLPLLAATVRGGVTAVQLRCKHLPPRDLVALTRRAVANLPVPVLVNDRLDVALIAGAAGVHLGADDVPPTLARAIAPPGFLVGATVGDDAEALRGAPADYWGIGPLHATVTKADAGDALGLSEVARLVALAAGRPTVVIGGVQPGDVEAVLASGANGVAVVSGILADPDPERAAARYRRGGRSATR